MADKYAVNYDDERFKSVENEKNQKLTETESLYDNMLANSDKFYQDQINASKEWSNKQQELQQQKTDFAIEQINQQKDQANKDYIKEQKGAYSDYQKQSNKYGANAEALASSGLDNSGYAQSSQVSMWNTYQNRKMVASENLNKAILNYDNGIKEAQLANSSALAQLAYTALQNELELALQGFQAKNQLLLQKQSQLQGINDSYYGRYQNVLAQINAEIERERSHDQWYEEFKQKQKAYDDEASMRRKEFALKEQQYAIENARAEKQLAAARANEGSYTVSGNEGTTLVGNTAKTGLGNVLGGVASALVNFGKSVVKPKSVDNITTIVQNLQKLKNKETMRQVLAASYKEGKLSDSDVEKIGNILGL